MIEILKDFLCSIFATTSCLYIFSRICGEKINLRNKKFYIVLFLNSVTQLISYYSTDAVLKMLINFTCLVLFTEFLFKKSINKSIAISLLTQFLIIISELMYTLVLVLIFRLDLTVLENNYFMSVSTNLIIAVIGMLIISNPTIRNYLQNKVESIGKENKIFVFFSSILAIFALALVICFVYFQLNLPQTILLAISLILSFCFLTFRIFQERLENMTLQTRYNIANQNLEEYEKMLHMQRKRNHENNNNLIAIKGMIYKRNKKALDYIDSLIQDKKDDDKFLYSKAKRVPIGGLQGLVYQKMLIMKDKSINYNLEISQEIKSNSFQRFDVEAYKNICMIIGIFLDNAIQAVEECDNKLIGIYIYKSKNKIYIKISNTYKGYIDVNEMSKETYSTKGEGHGYGLGLVSEIIEKNSLLENIKEFNGNVFSQILTITK